MRTVCVLNARVSCLLFLSHVAADEATGPAMRSSPGRSRASSQKRTFRASWEEKVKE